MRATVCVHADRLDHKLRAALWFHDWRDELSYVSENHGCGCCVDLFDVEGSPEAIARLHSLLPRCTSDWVDGKGEAPMGSGELPYQRLLRADSGASRALRRPDRR